jgi:hypothetical protein
VKNLRRKVGVSHLKSVQKICYRHPPGLELDSDLLRWSDGMSSSDDFFKKRAYCIKIEEESTTLLSNFHDQHLLGSTLSGDTPRSKTTLTNDPYRTNLPHSHLASCDP